MKHLANLMLCVLAIGLGGVAEAAEALVGFDAMQRLELLPAFSAQRHADQAVHHLRLRPATTTAALFKRYEENGEYVFFDEIGPGFLAGSR